MLHTSKDTEMKILHVVPSYIPAYRYGGPIWSVHALNKWLVKKGADVTVYTTNIDGPHNLDVPLGREMLMDGVKIFYFPVSLRFWQYSGEMRENLARATKDFDLIHITSVFLSVSTLGAYYAKKFNKPYIISPRGSLMAAPLQKKYLKKAIYLSLIEKRNLKNSSAIHFTSEEEKKDYVDAGLSLHSSVVVPNGFDSAEFEKEVATGLFRKKYGIGPSKKMVLFLSRISWKKGLDMLIPAFANAKKENSDLVLVIAGGDDENYKKTIDELIKKHNLKSDVIFTGMITGQDKIGAFSEANVFTLPSYAENFGNAVLEAMNSGLPVIITENVGIAREVEQAGAGLIIKKDENALAEAMLKLLNDYDLSLKMGKHGKELVLKTFSWPAIAEKFIKAYKELIKSNKNG